VPAAGPLHGGRQPPATRVGRSSSASDLRRWREKTLICLLVGLLRKMSSVFASSALEADFFSENTVHDVVLRLRRIVGDSLSKSDQIRSYDDVRRHGAALPLLRVTSPLFSLLNYRKSPATKKNNKV